MTSFARALGSSWQASAFPNKPFGGGPDRTRLLIGLERLADNAAPSGVKHDTWPTLTPRFDPRAERRYPCAPR
jgi:hypothetical protein